MGPGARKKDSFLRLRYLQGEGGNEEGNGRRTRSPSLSLCVCVRVRVHASMLYNVPLCLAWREKRFFNSRRWPPTARLDEARLPGG